MELTNIPVTMKTRPWFAQSVYVVCFVYNLCVPFASAYGKNFPQVNEMVISVALSFRIQYNSLLLVIYIACSLYMVII